MRTHRAYRTFSADAHRTDTPSVGPREPFDHSAGGGYSSDDTHSPSAASSGLSPEQAQLLASLSDRLDAFDQRIAETTPQPLTSAIASIEALERKLSRRLGQSDDGRRSNETPDHRTARGGVEPSAFSRPHAAASRRHVSIGEDRPHRIATPPSGHARETARHPAPLDGWRDLDRQTVRVGHPERHRPPAGIVQPPPTDRPAVARQHRAPKVSGTAGLAQDLAAARDLVNVLAIEARRARDPADIRALAASISILSVHLERISDIESRSMEAPDADRSEARRPSRPGRIGEGERALDVQPNTKSPPELCVGLSAVRNLERQVVKLAENLSPARRDPSLDAIERSLADLGAEITAIRETMASTVVPRKADELAPATGESQSVKPLASLEAGLEELKTYQSAADRRIQTTLSGIYTLLERFVGAMPAADRETGRHVPAGDRRVDERRTDVDRLLAALQHIDLGRHDNSLAPGSHRRGGLADDVGIAALDASLAAVKANFLAGFRRSSPRSFDD